jgi:hypothetical protein
MFAFNKASPLNGQLEEKQEKVLGDSPLDRVQENFIEISFVVKLLLTISMGLIWVALKELGPVLP